MNPKRNKKVVKRFEQTLADFQAVCRVEKPLPTNRKFSVGKASAMIPYFDHVENLVSSETRNSPIIMKLSPKKSTMFISKLLKQTGIEPLAEIGDAITGRH